MEKVYVTVILRSLPLVVALPILIGDLPYPSVVVRCAVYLLKSVEELNLRIDGLAHGDENSRKGLPTHETTQGINSGVGGSRLDPSERLFGRETISRPVLDGN